MSANSKPKTQTYRQWVDGAVRELDAAGFASTRLDAELLLSHTINKPRTYLHAHPTELLDARHQEIANARLALRLDRVPIAYIIGHKEFYGRRFSVSTAALVPRPESEDMIDLLKEIAGNNLNLLPDTKKRLIDIGTGCGVLGITAKLELPDLDVTLSDISRYALKLAEKNATLHSADVAIIESDLLENYPFKAHYVLANLPYVDPEWEHSEELQHEPSLALFAEDGGKSVIFRLLEQVGYSLTDDGLVFIEADPVQHSAITKKAKDHGLALTAKRGYQLVFGKVN